MKIFKTLYLPAFAFAVVITACSNPAPAPAPEPVAVNMDSLRTVIQAMEDAYSAAELANDADGVVAYYSDDAISYSRSMDPAIGKEAIRARIAERLEKDTTNNKSVYKIVDLYAEGDMAVEIGSWEDINEAGESVEHGHYMSYFEKRDGHYVCVRDMNVTSMPEKKAE